MTNNRDTRHITMPCVCVHHHQTCICVFGFGTRRSWLPTKPQLPHCRTFPGEFVLRQFLQAASKTVERWSEMVVRERVPPVAKYRLSSKTCCGMVELWANNLKERCCFVATLMSHSLPMLLTAGLTFLDRSRCALVHGLEMVYQQCIRMPQCFDAARSEVVPQSWSDIILRDCTAAEQSLLLV